MNKNNLIKGTFILTVAGLATRLLGFFYRIYLSNALGAEKLGIYQLIFPLYGICFTIYASGLQTAISQMAAAESAKGKDGHPKRILGAGLTISLVCSLTLSVLVWTFHDFIAAKLLLEPECSQSLKILAYVFPFCGITACINGYFYGVKNAAVPALTQFLEQVVRIGSVFVLAIVVGGNSMAVTCELAVFGVVLGEIASNLFNIASLVCSKKEKTDGEEDGNRYPDKKKLYKSILGFSVPLTMNRLLINLLHSFEAVLIPGMLRRHGLTSAEALSIYGIINGMVLPFIMFPGTITNSLSVLLLPAISEAQAADNRKSIRSVTSISIKYSLIVGIFSTGVFVVFGNALGTTVFGNETAGSYLRIIAWLCPLQYIATTLGSIINGLGKAHVTFINSIIGQALRVGLLFWLIPTYGITGYFIGLLISQIIITGLDYAMVLKYTGFTLDAVNGLMKPTAAAVIACPLFYWLYELMKSKLAVKPVILLFGCCILLCVVYLAALVLTKALKKETVGQNRARD